MADADPQNHHDDDIDVEKPCEICGDIGFINAIRDCSLCQSTREHAYCMKVMLGAEADAWICEECEFAKVALSSPCPNRQPEDASAIFMIKKPPQSTKVKYITPEEVRALESRAMKSDSMLQSKTHLSPRSSIVKASFCQRGLSALASNFSAKLGPHTGVPGFEMSLNGESLSGSSPNKQFSTSEEEPHLEKNVPTAGPCTFVDLVKDNSEKYGVHPVHISFQLVQCLPAVDLATMKKLKFRTLGSAFSHEKKNKSRSQSPEECAPCRAKMSKMSVRKPIDVASNPKGERRVQQTSKTVMMPPTKSQRIQEPTKFVSKNVCFEEPTDSSEADSDETWINRMHKRKPKVPEVNLKVKPMLRGDEFKEDDFEETPSAHHKCKRELKMNKVISGSKSGRDEESKEDESGETPLIYRIRKRKRKVNVVYSESESSPTEDEDELEDNYSTEPRNGLSFTKIKDGYAISDDLISSIVFEDRQLLDSMGDRVLEALYQSVKSALVMAASSIQSSKMSYPLKEGHAKLKDLEEEEVKLKALWEGVQSGRALLKEGIKKKLVLIDQFRKQVEEKLAEWEGRLLPAMSFVNQEFRKAINEGKLKLKANQGVQLMRRNQESLLAYQRGKEVAHRHLQSTILEMLPSLDWSLVEANYQALVDAEEARVAQEEKSLRSSSA